MNTKMKAIAVMVMLAGLVLINTIETDLVGGLLVTGGAYALVLPVLIEPQHPAGQ
jgi:hypothetical protein